MQTLSTTLLRLRARAGQLPPLHSAIVRACTDGRPTETELACELRLYEPKHRAAYRSALADLQAARIIVSEPMLTHRGRRQRIAPVHALRTAIEPEQARA